MALPDDLPSPGIPYLGQGDSYDSVSQRAKRLGRYSMLGPLSGQQELDIACGATSFFTPTNRAYFLAAMDRRYTDDLPFTIRDFIKWVERYYDEEADRRYHRIRHLLLRLETSGLLVLQSGGGIERSYLFLKELTRRQLDNMLWLGAALGPAFIARASSSAIARVTGTKDNLDKSIGTGVLATSRHVVTCAHVVRDMKLDEALDFAGTKYQIANVTDHPKVDIAVITLAEPVEDRPLLNWGVAQLLETLVHLGHAPVPRAVDATVTSQIAEPNNQIRGFDGCEYLLFSSLARPGDSGGPLISLDGNIVGIVTQSLERHREDGETSSPLPFFAAVPTEEIIRAVSELDSSIELPVEDFR